MSLFTRLIGTSGEKLPLHKCHALLDEAKQGRVTIDQVGVMLGLDDNEKSDASLIASKLTTDEKYRRVFNYMCLGELGIKEPYDYTDEDLFWLALESF